MEGHRMHMLKVAAGNIGMAVPPAMSMASESLFGVPHSWWLFIGGAGVLVLQGLYWLVQIIIKVRRERERMLLALPPETTDAAKL